MSKRTSITLSEQVEKVLKNYIGTGDSVSSVIAKVCERYTYLVTECLPAFSVNEWLLIFDSLNGYWNSGNTSLYVQGVEWNIKESLIELEKKWEIEDQANFLERVRKLGVAERLALIHAAEFWIPKKEGKSHENWEDALLEIIPAHKITKKVQ